MTSQTTASTAEKKPLDTETVPFFPDHLRTEIRVMVGILAVVIVIGAVGLLAPVGLGTPADPMDTPAHIKPEWYFLFLYQMLKFVPKTAGAVVPVLMVGVLVLWPFIDRKWVFSRSAIRYRAIFVALALILITALTVWGEVS